MKARSGSFNVLKAIVMLGMPFVHTLKLLMVEERIGEGFGQFGSIIYALTLFWPPIFMLTMGLGIAGNSSPKYLRSTGIRFLIISLAFNIVRLTILLTIFCALGFTTWTVVVSDMLSSDILNFVGLFYIVYSFVRERKLSNVTFLGLSFGALLVNIAFSNFISVPVPVISTILGNFVSVADDSYFPLLGWMIYPCIGMVIKDKVLGMELKKSKHVFLLFLGTGVALLAVTASIAGLMDRSVVDILVDFVLYSTYGFAQAGIFIGSTLVVISVGYLWYQSVRANGFERFFLKLSTLLFPFYLLHWVFVTLSTSGYSLVYVLIHGVTVPVPAVSFPMYLLIAAIILVSSLLICVWKGFTISGWILRVCDYTRWGKKQKSRTMS